MNHLEQLVGEWLRYNGYFVRTSVFVGARARGGFEGESDVVALNIADRRIIHVECSLDALSEAKREIRFAAKFERGRRFMKEVFKSLPVPEPDQIEQIAILQITGTKVRTLGSVRVITVRDLIHEIYAGLEGTSPLRKAVPSNLPLLRTLQLAADAKAEMPATAHAY